MASLRILLFVAPLSCAAALGQPDSPAAVRETQHLNQDQALQGAQTDSRYQQQQQIYEEQQQQYQAQKALYELQASRYLAARDRYAAERARYRRGEWPKRYERLAFVDSDVLIGAPVETYSGARVGHVDNVAKVGGRIDAVRIALDDGPGHAWVDRGDVKYDTVDRLVITDLARHDLHAMAAETY